MEKQNPFEPFCDEAWEMTIGTLRNTGTTDVLRHDPVSVAVEYLNNTIKVRQITSKAVAGDKDLFLDFAAAAVTLTQGNTQDLRRRFSAHGALRHFGRIPRLLGHVPELRYSPMRIDSDTVETTWYSADDRFLPRINPFVQGVYYRIWWYAEGDMVPRSWMQFIVQLAEVLSGREMTNLYLSEEPLAYAGRTCVKELRWVVNNQPIIHELATGRGKKP